MARHRKLSGIHHFTILTLPHSLLVDFIVNIVPSIYNIIMGGL